MKHFITAFIILLSATISYGQGSLPVGKNQLNIGVGLSEWGVPVYLGIDHGITRDITLGGELSFRAYREHWKSNYYRHNIIGISGNGNYHFNRALKIPAKYDFYAGLNIGFYVWSSPTGYEGTHNSGLGLGAQVGGRYYLSNKVGLNLELGGGSAFSGGKFGITIKL
ncbi:hypothetical protein ACQ33O_03805 [Ferruginibacter sp. SUN002]|uniref:hypothetical protein n=1 Tax=Ferruginibacter sp. SUN002 TaxID=2937789 RepID=UPI003D35B380